MYRKSLKKLVKRLLRDNFINLYLGLHLAQTVDGGIAGSHCLVEAGSFVEDVNVDVRRRKTSYDVVRLRTTSYDGERRRSMSYYLVLRRTKS